jgi:hypothetical protein
VGALLWLTVTLPFTSTVMAYSARAPEYTALSISVELTPVVTMLRTMEMSPGLILPANTSVRSWSMLSTSFVWLGFWRGLVINEGSGARS